MKLITGLNINKRLQRSLCHIGMISIMTYASTSLAQAQTLWVDVRTPEEFATGHVLNADNFPYEDIVSLASHHGYAKDDTLLLYCRSGHRAGIARQSLLDAGYTNVQNLGGFDDLAETGAVKVSDTHDNDGINDSDDDSSQND